MWAQTHTQTLDWSNSSRFYLTKMFVLVKVIGASWYLASIGRQYACWKQRCLAEYSTLPHCVNRFLDCSSSKPGDGERQHWLNVTTVLSLCDASNDESDFKFGMFADAFTSEVASAPFIEKYLYCLWWGLRNLRFEHEHDHLFFACVWGYTYIIMLISRLLCSSYGQTLDTSTYIGETTFCIVLCIFGLVLFAQLIGNMQVLFSFLAHCIFKKSVLISK